MADTRKVGDKGYRGIGAVNKGFPQKKKYAIQGQLLVQQVESVAPVVVRQGFPFPRGSWIWTESAPYENDCDHVENVTIATVHCACSHHHLASNRIRPFANETDYDCDVRSSIFYGSWSFYPTGSFGPCPKLGYVSSKHDT